VIILDTNVISDLLAPLPSAVVIGWLADQHPPSVFMTAVCEAEILYGSRLPPERAANVVIWRRPSCHSTRPTTII
jgi:predicted nucleic acid-binding protein